MLDDRLNLVGVLTSLLKLYDTGDKLMSPSDLLRQAGLQEWRNRDISRAFLELCRLRKFADGVVEDSRRLQTDMDRTSAVVMVYLLTGHLRPENSCLLDRFLATANFQIVTSTVYALEELAPINRYYYKELLLKNLYAKEMVNEWYSKDEKFPGFADTYLSRFKTKVVSLVSCFGRRRTKKCVPRISRLSIAQETPNIVKINAQSNQEEPKGNEKSVGKPNLNVKGTFMFNREEKTSNHNTFENFKTKYYDPYEQPAFTIEGIETQEKINISPKVIVESENYKNGNLLKTRTDFINLDKETSKRNYVRTNAATLLKEAAIILKEEEEESKKILDLLVGSSNFREYEKMIEERIEEEQQLFKLRIERLHLEGKLTEQAAILAKLRLKEESKERRKQFEEEREELLEDMNRLRESEQRKISALVSKVKQIHDRVVVQKQHMKEKKRKEVEALTKEIQRSVREAMAEEKKKLEKRVLIIQEVRAYQAFKKSLEKNGICKKVMKDAPKIGLFSEMSLEELEARKKVVQSLVSKEQADRRESILKSIKEKEELLDRAERFIQESRERRKVKRGLRQDPPEVDFRFEIDNSNLTTKFSMPVHHSHDKELMIKDIINNIKDTQIYNSSKALKYQQECYKKYKEKEVLDNVLKNKLINIHRKNKYLSESLVVTKKKTKESKINNSIESKQELSLLSQLDNNEKQEHIVLWGKFKISISKKIQKKLPKIFKKLKPPKAWMIFEKNLSDSNTAVIKNEKAKNRKPMLTSKRNIYYKNPLKRKWKKRWQKFYQYYTEQNKLKEHIGGFNEAHTKKIISQIHYFHNLVMKKDADQQDQIKNIIKENEDKIIKLKAKLEYATDRIRKAKRVGESSTIKSSQEIDKLKHLQHSKQNLCVLNAENPFNDFINIMNYKETVIKIPLFEEEDNEILETVIQSPFRPIIHSDIVTSEDKNQKQTFLKSDDHDSHIQVEVPDKPLFHLWEIKRTKLKSPQNVEGHSLFPKRIRRTVSYGNKYSHLRSRHGNPIFTLRPSMLHPSKWEWAPLLVKTSWEGRLMGPGRGGLLHILLNIRHRNNYRGSLTGRERTDFFKSGPIKMIQDYVGSSRFPQDPRTATNR